MAEGTQGESGDLDRLAEVARRLSNRIHAGMALRALEQDNKWRSMLDRMARGLPPWGAQGSRYEPTEEVDEP